MLGLCRLVGLLLDLAADDQSVVWACLNADCAGVDVASILEECKSGVSS